MQFLAPDGAAKGERRCPQKLRQLVLFVCAWLWQLSGALRMLIADGLHRNSMECEGVSMIAIDVDRANLPRRAAAKVVR